MSKKSVLWAFCILVTSCSSKHPKINSPLFDQDTTQVSEKESLQTISQAKSFEILEQKKMQETVADENAKFITYTAKGGEQLSFVARSLLGDPGKTEKLLNWNPHILNGPLPTGSEVLVKVDELNPIAIYLSKDLIEKNSEILEKSLNKFKKTTSYTTVKGDTLQKISFRFYSTTRNWTLLYLFNMNSIAHPDRLEVGTVLKVPQN